MTATSPVRLLVVTDRAFRSVLEQMPSIATKVLQSLGERLHSDARASLLAKQESAERIPAA